MSDALDLFEVTHVMDWQGQQAVNTYTYVCLGSSDPSINGAAQLEQQWRTRFLMTDGMGFQCGAFQETLVSVLVRVKNLYNPAEFAEYLDGTTPGTAVGQPSSPYDAFSFRTPWLGSQIRRGFKRFPGVPETYGSGGVVQSAFVTLLGGMEDALNEVYTLTLGSETLSFSPCIVKRVKYVAPSGRDAYRLPENPTEGLFNDTTAWQLIPRLTTQNSRKIGYGA